MPSAIVEFPGEPSQAELDAATQVVVLGTGTPIPDATRAGFSIAVIHKAQAYLFDIGAGSVRNAVIARYKYDIPSLYPTRICCVFLTHLHNDHTTDFLELATTLWWRDREALRAWGPAGLQELVDGMYAMMAPDIAIRSTGNQPVRKADAYEVEATEISEGIVFQKDDLTVEAFSVNHGEVKPAFGYKITTDDKSIVISGDTAYSEKLIEMSKGVDLLFHEVISDKGLSTASEGYQAYHRKSHTPAGELGRLASIARPGLLVLVHALFYGVPEDLVVDEVQTTYDGEVVLANDLDIF
jgi:ribonuclease BN (tRNA processing enzyme)